MQVDELRGVDNGYLHDTQLVLTTTRSLTFFGRTRSVGASNTNLRQAGQLPKGESFEVRAMSVGIMPGGIYGAAAVQQTTIDVFRAMHQATLTFTIQTKPVIDAWPVHVFNLGWSTISSDYVAAAAGSYGGQGDASTVFRFPHPFKINENESFAAVVNWDVAPSGLVSSQTMLVALIGTHIRSVQ